MRRRRFLAALGAAALAGCADRDPPTPAGHDQRTLTPPENVTVYTETTERPDAPAAPTAAEAREFVAAHEQALVYNELIGEGEPLVRSSGHRYPTTVDVEDATTHVVCESDAGVYVLSSCSGRAEYYCEYADPNRDCGRSMERNAHAVTHFVGDGEHVRIPFNAYACERADEPYAGKDTAENVALDDHERAARLDLYDFTGGEPDVQASVTHRESGDVVLERSYSLSLKLAVQPDVTRRRGTYDIEATVDGTTATGAWTVTDLETPSWTGQSVYVTPTGEPLVLTVGLDGPIRLPDTACRRRPDGE